MERTNFLDFYISIVSIGTENCRYKRFFQLLLMNNHWA